MKYPKTMHEATQAAHEARSDAFFGLLGTLGRLFRLLVSLITPTKRSTHKPEPAPSPQSANTP